MCYQSKTLILVPSQREEYKLQLMGLKAFPDSSLLLFRTIATPNFETMPQFYLAHLSMLSHVVGLAKYGAFKNSKTSAEVLSLPSTVTFIRPLTSPTCFGHSIL